MSKAFLKLERISDLVAPLSEMLTLSLLLGILLAMATLGQGQMAVSLTFLLLLYRLQPRVKQIDAARVTLDSLSASVEAVRSLLDNSDKPYLRLQLRHWCGLQIGREKLSYPHGIPRSQKPFMRTTGGNLLITPLSN